MFRTTVSVAHPIRGLAWMALLAVTACSSASDRAADYAQQSAVAFNAGDFVTARLAMLRAVGQRDDVPDYWIALAQLNMRLRDLGGAYDAYSHALELQRDNMDALQNLGEISLAIGRLDDATKHADQTLAIDPQDVRARLVKGYVALRQKRYAEASSWADRILADYPLEDAPLVLKARSIFESGRRADAIALIEKAIPVRGASRPKLDTLIEFYGTMGDRDGIERSYNRYVELDPDNEFIKLKFATELYKMGKRAGAEGILVPMLQNGQQPEKAADVMINYGGESPSLALLEQASADVSPPVAAAIARIALEKGYPELTMRLLQPYIAAPMSPSTATAIGLYAAGAEDAGRHDEAMRLAEQVLEFDEASPRALRVRALVSLARGNLNQALTDARVLVRDRPDAAEDRLLLARIYVARNEFRLAESILRQAFNDLPGNTEVLEQYLAFLQQQKRAGAAADLAQDFIERNPRSSEGWKLRADLCRAIGDAACVAESMQAHSRLEMAQGRSPEAA